MASDLEGGLVLALARGAAVAALLSAFGVLVFRVLVLPRSGAAAELAARLSRFARWNLVTALALLAAWLVLQSAALAETGVFGGFAVTPEVLGGTVFGRALAAQAVMLGVALTLVGRWPVAALVPAGAAVALQAVHGHGYAMADGAGLLAWSTVLHLLSAGAWLGGLWPLLMAVRDGTPRSGAMAARWFSPLGKWCVAGMVVSAAVQGWVLLGGLPGLIGTAYGRVALVKLALFGALLGFAWVNRHRLAPALLQAAPETARWRLVRAVGVQTGFGLATVLAAGLLASLPPGAHEQPLWPFAVRPSLVAMAEPELAAEVWQGAALLGAATVVLAAAVAIAVFTRWRRPRRGAVLGGALVVAAGLAWSAWPHLSPLLVEAYPTSYDTSPTGFAATSIMRGAALYPPNCASCHGIAGRGDGPAAAGLAVPPADLTAPHLWEHADGELFWWLSHGMEAPDGTPVMPGFADRLSEEERWALIDAIRARNAGTSAGGGSWTVPVALPGFAVVCPGGVQRTTEDMRGRILMVRLGGGTVSIDGACTTQDPAAWSAIAVVTGQSAEDADGSRLLVDGEGWLRAWTARNDRRWDDPAALARTVAAIEAAPLAPATGGHHH